MSIWEANAVEARVLEVLADVRTFPEAHQFGRPYISAYQLAIELHRRYPDVAQALDHPVGGAGIEQRNSLAQYLARELSRRIGSAPDDYPVEGAFMSNQDVRRLEYTGPDNEPIVSSLTGSGWDLSMFRLRGEPQNSP